MKKSEIQPAVLSGRKIVVGEFRDHEAREIPDKKNQGQFNVFDTCFVLVGRDSAEVTKFAPRGVRALDVKKPAFKRGELVVVEFTDWHKDKFGLRVSGEITALVDG